MSQFERTTIFYELYGEDAWQRVRELVAATQMSVDQAMRTVRREIVAESLEALTESARKASEATVDLARTFRQISG